VKLLWTGPMVNNIGFIKLLFLCCCMLEICDMDSLFVMMCMHELLTQTGKKVSPSASCGRLSFKS
jgi:hypothetical protein